MNARAGVPWRPLVLLASLVLVLHALALRLAPPGVPWQPAPLRIRLLDAPPPPAASMAAAPQPAPAPAPVPAAAPARARAAPARPAASVPAPAAPLAAAPAAVALPAAARWHYAVSAQVRGVPASGDALLDWDPAGERYAARLRIDVPGLAGREQQSVGAIDALGLAPLRFSDRRRTEEATHFDREHGRIVFSSNRPGQPLLPGTQDRVSVLLQLSALAAGAPSRVVPGAALAIPTTGTREAQTWPFTVEDHETLALPGGTLQALRLVRPPMHPYDARLEVWLAPGADYAPVRLRLTPPNGDWLDLQWSGTDKR